MIFSVLSGRGLDATPLGRAAAVVRNRGDVGDRTDLEADGAERADRGLAARARALDEDIDALHAVLHRPPTGRLGGHLGGVRSRLARALEPDRAGRGPRDDRASRVGDRDDGVVERALDVRVPGDDVLLLLLAHLLRGRAASSCGCHYLAFFLPATGLRAPLRERALVRVRWPRTGRPLRWRRPW